MSADAPGRVAAMTRHELRLMRRDMGPLLVMVLMPLVVIPFVQPSLKLALNVRGYDDVSGAEHAVPGMAVLFGFFLTGFIGASVFREHGWETWDRLRASPIRRGELLAAKALPGLVIIGVQQLVLFGVGTLLLDLRITGSAIGLVAVGLAFAAVLCAMSLAFTGWSGTFQQLNAFSLIGTMGFAGFAGALTPELPEWAQRVAPATPGYWAMRGFRQTILEGADIGTVLPSIAALGGFALAFTVLTALTFDIAKRRIVA